MWKVFAKGGFCFFLCVRVRACATAKARKNVTSDTRKKERERKTNKHGSSDNPCVRCASFVNVRQMTVRWSMCSKHGWGAGGHPEPRRLVWIRVFAPRYRGFAARHLRHRWEFAGSKERQGEYLLRSYFLYICDCLLRITNREREVWEHLKIRERTTPSSTYTHIMCLSRILRTWRRLLKITPGVYRPVLLSRAPSVALSVSWPLIIFYFHIL